MWRKLEKQIALERGQLNHLIQSARPLIAKAAGSEMETTDVWAAAALLHAYYSGVENVFKRIRWRSGVAA